MSFNELGQQEDTQNLGVRGPPTRRGPKGPRLMGQLCSIATPGTGEITLQRERAFG
jgi:hypothetical protein